MHNLKKFYKPDYKYIFNKDSGFFIRWGRTEDEDPEYSPYGNEIADIEVSTICSNGCPWCYKSNTCEGQNMDFQTFKTVFDNMPETLTQIAFGIGDIDANPDLWKMMDYCRENDVVPNITINGSRMTPQSYDLLAYYCGAVAVSLYNKETCYDAVYELTRRGMKQVNIHCLLADETYDKCKQVMEDSKTDSRLKDLNAIVFLWLKPLGERNTLTQIKQERYDDIVTYAMDNEVPIGFDSCSAPQFADAIKRKYPSKFNQLYPMIEPCESTLFSYYVNVEGKGFPCSFAEQKYEGIDLTKAKSFEDFWYGKETSEFREKVMENTDHNNCRMCPIYNLGCKGDINED